MKYLVLFLLSFSAFAQIEGHWLSETKEGIIHLTKKEDGLWYGKLVATKINPETKGLDVHNPDESKRTQPVRGQEILTGLKADSDTDFSGGKIYDPKSGKTYKCKMTLEGDKLDIRGFVGISLFGRTSTWTRFKDPLPANGDL